MSIIEYNILNELIDFNFIDYNNNILNELMSFNLDPTKLYVMKILDLNNIPMYLWEQFYEYLSKDNMLHLNIIFNNKQFKLCFKFNIMYNSSTCLTCDLKLYDTCYKCKNDHFDNVCGLEYDKCTLCLNCSNNISHDYCDQCGIPLCAQNHMICDKCTECWNSQYDNHIYCEHCDLCNSNIFHTYCDRCNSCHNSQYHVYCNKCNSCHNNITKYKWCEYCNQCCNKTTHQYCDRCETCYNTDTDHICVFYCIYCEQNYSINNTHHFCEKCTKCSSSLHIFDRYRQKCIKE